MRLCVVGIGAGLEAGFDDEAEIGVRSSVAVSGSMRLLVEDLGCA